MRISLALACITLILSSCGNSKPEEHTTAVPSSDKSANQQATVVPKTTSADLSGTYEEVDDPDAEGCDIVVTISKAAGGYHYHLAYDSLSYEGQLGLDKRNDHTTGIVFKGIPYAETSIDDDDDGTNARTSSDVGGELEGDTITIQNYGNSMNYYVKLGGCGLKYIRLVKRH
ncbi:hypothetical protein LLH06_19325 [Mucilaginibacter daejeonensis]|uniref:hypothetical protein n=1 Tax=Mucilaginibacter daejeonensis TaxID=398049 RepID=UPI001D1726FA|nr:hypothetical protein [Mucilaginibacter daejeonensis]UEG53099.1 hypothetical protein LLH06_19325 [Mucilaginibacter daejeonensis]